MAFGDTNEYLGITENTLYVLNDQSGYSSESSTDYSPNNMNNNATRMGNQINPNNVVFVNNNKNNINNKNKKLEQFDSWTLEFSDDLWYMWNILKEYTQNASIPILDLMDYTAFVNMCHANSSKYIKPRHTLSKFFL
jgi:hypothetical protein